MRSTAYGLLALVLELALARVALAWGGDLDPIPLWFGTASTTALALVADRQYRWPIILGGAVAGVALTALWLFGSPIGSLLGPIVSAVAEVTLAVFALERLIGRPLVINRTRRAFWVVLISASASSLGATIIVASVWSEMPNHRLDVWITWTLGHMIALTILIPLSTIHRVPLITPNHALRRVEAVFALLTLAGSSILSFKVSFQLVYIIVPGVLWLAIRFGPRLASPATLFVTIIATDLSGRGSGPFVNVGGEPVIQVQSFNLAIALCSLLAGGHAVRAWNDQQQLGAILRALPDAVALRSSTGRLEHAWVPSSLGPGIASLLSQSDTSDNPLDKITPGGTSPTRVQTADGLCLEHRSVSMEDGRQLHLYRNVTEQDHYESTKRELSLRLAKARQTEQARIGMLLHDGPMQTLSSISLLVGFVQQGLADEDSKRLALVERLTEEAIDDLRALADRLIPPSARDGELGSALLRYGQAAFEGRGINLAVDDSLDQRVRGPQAEALYLIGREALSNVALHSGADEVKIVLHATDGTAVLEINDNGSGFKRQTSDQSRHFGIQLMHDRVSEHAGSVRIENRPIGGVCVHVEMPYDS